MRLLHKILITIILFFLLGVQEVHGDGYARHFGISGMISMGITEASLAIMPGEYFGPFLCGVVWTSFIGATYESIYRGPDSGDDMKANIAGAFTGALVTAGIHYLTRDTEDDVTYFRLKAEEQKAIRIGQRNYMIWWNSIRNQKTNQYLEDN